MGQARIFVKIAAATTGPSPSPLLPQVEREQLDPRGLTVKPFDRFEQTLAVYHHNDEDVLRERRCIFGT